MALERPALARLRPAAKPLAGRLAVRERGFVDQRLHLVDQGGEAVGAAHAHLEQRLLPDRDEARHRLPQRSRARPRPLHQRPALLHQAAPHEVDGQHAQQGDLRVGREHSPPGPATRRSRGRAPSTSGPPACGPADDGPRRAGSTRPASGRDRPTRTRALRRALRPPAPPRTRRAGSTGSRTHAAGARASGARARGPAARRRARRRSSPANRRQASGRPTCRAASRA